MWAWLTGRRVPSPSPSPPPPPPPIRDHPLAPTPRQRAVERFVRARPQRRVEFNLRSATAYGRPSTGGLIVKRLRLVDLLALGVSRTTHTLRPAHATPDEEDAWCAQLYPLGVAWYEDWRHYERSPGDRRTETRIEHHHELFVGWPSSGQGVWVLTLPEDQREIFDFGVYDMCMTMDERCAVLERLGARFYEHPADCADITSAVVDKYKREREELKKELLAEGKVDAYDMS